MQELYKIMKGKYPLNRSMIVKDSIINFIHNSNNSNNSNNLTGIARNSVKGVLDGV